MSKARDLANAGTALTTVSATELGYLDGVTSAVQTQLDAKLATATAATTYQAINANVSTTELGYLDGVTSSIQTQLNQKPEVVAGKNKIINGDFSVWQRGTSFNESATSFYTADRWQVDGQTTGRTYSRQTTSDTTNLPNIQYCLRVQRTAANATTTRSRVLQAFESVNSIPLAGKTITLSFYARAGSNYSPASSALGYTLYSGTGTDQNPRTGTYTGQTLPLNSTTAITTTWARYSFSATLPTDCSEITPMFYADWVGTAGTNDYFEITGVQIEIGSTATAFQTATGNIQGELAACQRYYYRLTSGAAYSTLIPIGITTSTTVCGALIQHPVPMRAVTSFEFSTIYIAQRVTTSTDVVVTSATLGENNTNITEVALTVASGLTVRNFATVKSNNSASAYIAVNGEL